MESAPTMVCVMGCVRVIVGHIWHTPLLRIGILLHGHFNPLLAAY